MSAESFSDALEVFFKTIRRARARWSQSGGSVGGLTIAQFLLVVPLKGGTPLSVRELAAGAGIAAPTASRLLDGLERDGLVVRRQGEQDRRRVMVELTPDGRDALDAALRDARARRRRIYDALTPQEREEAERVLRRLSELMDSF